MHARQLPEVLEKSPFDLIVEAARLQDEAKLNHALGVASIHVNSKELRTPIFQVASEGNDAAVEFLIQHGAHPSDACGGYVHYRTHKALSYLKHIEEKFPLWLPRALKYIAEELVATNHYSIASDLKKKIAKKKNDLDMDVSDGIKSGWAKLGEIEKIKKLSPEDTQWDIVLTTLARKGFIKEAYHFFESCEDNTLENKQALLCALAYGLGLGGNLDEGIKFITKYKPKYRQIGQSLIEHFTEGLAKAKHDTELDLFQKFPPINVFPSAAQGWARGGHLQPLHSLLELIRTQLPPLNYADVLVEIIPALTKKSNVKKAIPFLRYLQINHPDQCEEAIKNVGLNIHIEDVAQFLVIMKTHFQEHYEIFFKTFTETQVKYHIYEIKQLLPLIKTTEPELFSKFVFMLAKKYAESNDDDIFELMTHLKENFSEISLKQVFFSIMETLIEVNNPDGIKEVLHFIQDDQGDYFEEVVSYLFNKIAETGNTNLFIENLQINQDFLIFDFERQKIFLSAFETFLKATNFTDFIKLITELCQQRIYISHSVKQAARLFKTSNELFRFVSELKDIDNKDDLLEAAGLQASTLGLEPAFCLLKRITPLFDDDLGRYLYNLSQGFACLGNVTGIIESIKKQTQLIREREADDDEDNIQFELRVTLLPMIENALSKLIYKSFLQEMYQLLSYIKLAVEWPGTYFTHAIREIMEKHDTPTAYRFLEHAQTHFKDHARGIFTEIARTLHSKEEPIDRIVVLKSLTQINSTERNAFYYSWLKQYLPPELSTVLHQSNALNAIMLLHTLTFSEALCWSRPEIPVWVLQFKCFQSSDENKKPLSIPEHVVLLIASFLIPPITGLQQKTVLNKYAFHINYHGCREQFFRNASSHNRMIANGLLDTLSAKSKNYTVTEEENEGHDNKRLRIKP